MAKILLVDDMIFFRKMYCDILHNAGFDVLEAADGLQGIQKAQEEQPDLILLDMAMPGLDGLTTLERLKGDGQTNRIKVIVLSGKDNTQDIKEAIQLGAEDYLLKTENKPVDVVQKIQNVLEASSPESVEQAPGRSDFSRETKKYRIFLRDREEDADNLVTDCNLPQRLWCPKCQEELILELTPDTSLAAGMGKHRFKARLLCPKCNDEF